MTPPPHKPLPLTLTPLQRKAYAQMRQRFLISLQPIATTTRRAQTITARDLLTVVHGAR